MADLWRSSAREVVSRLSRGVISPVEAVDAAIARIEAVDPLVNAVPIRDFERARAKARAFKAEPTSRGWLAGLPVLIKDMADVAGLLTTMGDPGVTEPAAVSDIVVRTIEAHGGIVLGKTNVPFQGLGRDTDNPRFGLTRNPLDLTLSTAGSSGGAAAALASGMAWLAHGSDLGGSVRGPAAFCGVVGLRPSPGRIAHGGTGTRRRPLDTLVVEGPMARDVRDCALFLDAMAAAHPQDPLSFDPPAESFVRAAEAARLPKRIAFGVDLGGAALVEPEVAAVVTAAMKRIAAAGADVVETSPDFAGVADAAYDLRRGFTLQRHTRETFEAQKAMMSPILRKTVEDSFGLTLDAYLAAEARQQKLVADLRDLFNTYDVFALPTLQQVPYKAGGAPSEGAPAKFKHWAEAALTRYGLTLSWCPAISVPCGRTADGRSIGLQLVGRPRGEAALLAHAAAIEDLLDEAARVPVTPVKEGVPA